MRTTPFVFVVIFLFGLGSMACSSSSSSTTTDTSATEAANFCDRTCARAVECKPDDPKATSCATSCPTEYGRIFSRLHADARNGLLTCIEAASCDKVKVEGFGGECLEKVLDDLPQRPAVEEMCRAVGDRLRECRGRLDESTCRTAKLFSDEMIASARSCAEKPCEEVPTCWKGVFSF